jgi:proteasome lid subunit RPN8/RPN11
MNTFRRFLLRIPATMMAEMLAHAESERPYECCGLLAGRISEDGSVAIAVKRYPLRNELESETEFLSDAREMLAAVKEMRREGIDVVAVYHSHPSSEPVPSRRDLERNYSERVVNLIIGPGGEARGWWLAGGSCESAIIEPAPM